MPTSPAGQAPQQVKLELSHPTDGEDMQANLRVIDAESHETILSVRIPPLSFYKLLAGVIDTDTVPAVVLTAEQLERIGKRRWFWTRRIGNGVTESDAQAWADAIRERLELHTAHVTSRRGGLWAEWRHWSNHLDDGDRASIQADIDAFPLPGTRMKVTVPDLETEVLAADERLLGAGFQRVVWHEDDDPKALYVLRIGLWAVRAWLRPAGAQLDLGTREGEMYVFRPWSIDVESNPDAVASEAIRFAAAVRYLDTPGGCGVE